MSFSLQLVVKEVNPQNREGQKNNTALESAKPLKAFINYQRGRCADFTIERLCRNSSFQKQLNLQTLQHQQQHLSYNQ